MLTTLAAFVFIINQDPMTDAKTFEARIGDKRAAISILCGEATGDKAVVEFKAPSEMAVYSDRRASVEWRFDEDAPEKRWAFWSGERATISGKDAVAFAQRAATASRIRTRIMSASGQYDDFDARAVIGKEAIDQVLRACKAR